MILTPLDPQALPHILDHFERGLKGAPTAQSIFRRIAATRAFCAGMQADLFAGCGKAIALAHRLGIGVIDEEPAVAFSWDGQAIRTRSETSVVFHEIAHWQIAPTTRRGLYDFGLGAGPETGRVAEANAVVCVDRATQEDEENLASLLGILWETAYDEPAILAFAEQNWLEFYDRPSTQAHFVAYVERLRAMGLIDDAGLPQARG